MSATIRNGYEIVHELGSGSTGTVFLCRHKELDGHHVAMRVLYHEIAATLGLKERIEASYAVSHPNVVRLYERLADGYTMEVVGGGSLLDLLNSDLPFSQNQALEILRQILEGLVAIHEAKLTHGNLSAANILLTKNGDAKLSDDYAIGPRLSKGEESASGDVHYLAPECFTKRESDVRSDIYSVGVIAFELLTGRLPFICETPEETIKQKTSMVAQLVRDFNPSLSFGLSDLVARALARDPKKRFQTAREMLSELAKVADQRVLH